MPNFIASSKLEETILWKQLMSRPCYASKDFPTGLLAICADAASRMKLMATYAPQYTLHDETHLLRVVDLMGHILGDDADNLDGIELVLLILSAYFHDQGMVPTSERYEEILVSEDFQLHRENWRIEHPNYKEIQRRKLSPQAAKSGTIEPTRQIAEMDQAQLTEYLRANHGKESASYVQAEYGSDKRMQSDGIPLAPYLASLCESHTRQCSDICNLPYCSWDEQIGHRSVNMVFLAIILRIADILDFDWERTPDVLFRSIHFTSKVSIHEWERHRSVVGWSISPEEIRITAECTDPTYHRATNQYIHWIEQEIRDSKHLLRQQPHSVEPKEIRLPDVIDNKRVRPKNNSYRVHDLEFGLERDEIVRLLMTDKLYGNPGLCVRELLQNSLDALRYRKALFAEAGIGWETGKVTLRHYRNPEGEEVLECCDNGIGMDEEIIRNFLTKVGRSYYRSPFFERERSRLQKSGFDFDPCSKFGIGFMSCFMIGDRIEVKTRKDYRYGKEWGPPLVIEVHGLSGTVVVRDGHASQQPGTTISVVSRTNATIFDEWGDKIKLCSIVEGYALATEFPIEARCEIDSIADKVELPNSPAIFPTALEMKGVQGAFLIEQSLDEVHPDLKGYVRESFLIDEFGKLALANKEGKWVRADPHKNRMCWEYKANEHKQVPEITHYEGIGDIPVCIDGILLTGPPGRNRRSGRSKRLGWSNSHIYSKFSALLDARV
ncbi:MAG: HD domain-containing protein [Verrucomicrobiales bacterium]